ncbi:MAG: hypothetical protein ABEL97_06340 [Salinibacter sp.]
MTLSTTVQSVFSKRGLDRDDALVAAKALGQKIIDESKSTGTPLEGIVYEVWGLYDDGMPACQFDCPDSGDELVFSGKFRTAGGGSYVERERTVSVEDLDALVQRPSPLDRSE